jgi:GDP-L-fucose synthase
VTGFVGTNLAARLVAMGAKVRGVSRRRPLGPAHAGVEHLRADLTDAEDCRRAIEGMDFVFMCAASTSGAAVITSTPLAHVTPNVVMNAQMLDAAHAAGVEKLLFVSSCAAYPATDHPAAEDEMFAGDPPDVYFAAAWMKRYAELLCATYATRLRQPMPTVVVRPSNAYGPHDKFEFETSHVTAALIRRVVERHRPIEVWGTGDDVRDLIYIDDLVDGMIAAFEHDAPHLVVNLASGRARSVREILAALLDVDDYRDADVRYDASKPRTVPARLVDTSYAKRELGFEARTELPEGLRRTVRWYRENAAKTEAHR